MKPEYKTLRRSVIATLAKPLKQEIAATLESCFIPLIRSVPQDAVVIIGHAYGNPSDPDEFPSESLLQLLTQNKGRIKHVIFTGDVFGNPSKKRWQRLRGFFEEYEMDFSIAPGNHDVQRGDNASRDVFLDQIGEMHLRSLVLDREVVIIEDSTRNDWLISDELVELVAKLSREYPSKKLIAVRHHIPVEELLPLANSRANKAEEFPAASDLARQFNKKSVAIISGDSGAFPDLPRSSCHSYQNLTFYTNGLGGIGGDEVLILHQGKIGKLAL